MGEKSRLKKVRRAIAGLVKMEESPETRQAIAKDVMGMGIFNHRQGKKLLALPLPKPKNGNMPQQG